MHNCLLIKKDSNLLFSPGKNLPADWQINQVAQGCNWTGIICFNNQIFGIQLPSLGITGEMIPTFENFTGLQLIDLEDNFLTGGYPVFPQYCFHIILSNNNLNGTIPDVFNEKVLASFTIDNNKFTGCLPPSLQTAKWIKSGRSCNLQNNYWNCSCIQEEQLIATPCVNPCFLYPPPHSPYKIWELIVGICASFFVGMLVTSVTCVMVRRSGYEMIRS